MDELEIKKRFEEAEKMYFDYCNDRKECDLKYLYEIFNEYANKYNDANAKYYLGEMYYYGLYVERNDEIAYFIFRELKDHYDDARARMHLGKMYYFGIYVKQDYKRAYDIFNKIVKKYKNESSSVKDIAEYFIGRMYKRGDYLKKDLEKAFKIFNNVLNRETCYEDLKVNLKYYIALAYYYGEYVEQNYEKAFEIFNEIKNDKFAKFYIGEMYYLGDYVKKDFEKAFEIFNEISDDEYAQYYLGRMYEKGEYVEKDKEKAVEFYILAAEKNECKSIKRLIEINAELCNEEEMVKYCKQLISINDDGDAKKKLYDLYSYKSEKAVESLRENMDELPYVEMIKEKAKKAKEAVEILKESIKYGCEYQKFELAYMYTIGEFIEENAEEGLKIYKELAKHEHELFRREAKYVLGQLYYEGEENEINIKSNKQKGLKLLEEAAEEGNGRAIERLQEIKNNK